MKSVEISDATGSLAEYAREAVEEPLVLTDGGKPIAALVPIENADLETATLCTDPRFMALIERARTRRRTEGGISSEEMRRRLQVEPGQEG